MPYDRSRACAWVVEETGDPTYDEDPLAALGLFNAHVETEQGPEAYEPGPERVPAEEAIAWSRVRASRVIVRVYGGDRGTIHYSAGDAPAELDEGPLPPWPEDGVPLSMRRLPGWEHVDRTDADPPIDWDVVVRPLQGWGKPIEGFGQAFATALQRQGRARLVDWRELPGGGFSKGAGVGEDVVVGFVGRGNPAAEAIIRLAARTVDEAERLAKVACEEATAAVLEERGIEPHTDPMPWSSEADAYPTASRAAALNARLSDASGRLL
jgi:hypothetical protein